MKMTDATPDDLRILQARGLIKIFDDKVLVILNWKENNYIQKDRYQESKYLEIYKKELKALAENEQLNSSQITKCIQNVSKMDTQVRLGKDRKEENVETSSTSSNSSLKQKKEENTIHIEIKELFDYYKQEFTNRISDELPIFNWGVCEKLAKPYIQQLGLEKMKKLIDKYLSSKNKFYRDEKKYALSFFLTSNTLHELSF